MPSPPPQSGFLLAHQDALWETSSKRSPAGVEVRSAPGEEVTSIDFAHPTLCLGLACPADPACCPGSLGVCAGSLVTRAR